MLHALLRKYFYSRKENIHTNSNKLSITQITKYKKKDVLFKTL